MPEQQKYLIEVFLCDAVSGERRSCGKFQMQVKNYTLYVELPKDIPELSRIEIEFKGKLPT